ncbi:hypothetical protein [Streptomyces nojiriensis]|uniref:hypothetical protein n=1 Tax=Streptomyces nojiriensis TaxID=66374 RepID=UPI003654419F
MCGVAGWMDYGRDLTQERAILRGDRAGGQGLGRPRRRTPEAPFVRDLAQHVAGEHKEILLNSDDLSDPGVRAAVLAATDLLPMRYGDR